MEAHLGRYLEPGEIVHHHDEVKSNNALSNLRLKTRAQHAREHRLRVDVQVALDMIRAGRSCGDVAVHFGVGKRAVCRALKAVGVSYEQERREVLCTTSM